MHVLMVGFGRSFVRNLEDQVEPRTIRVLEEPDVYWRKRLDRESFRSVGDVLLAEYQQHQAFLATALHSHYHCPFQAVVPGIEYAVEAAAAVASRLNLPGAGRRAATVLRDKLLLRDVSARAGVPNPAWAEVHTAEDVRRFSSGRRVVLKPANRQASLGVFLLDDMGELDEAWQEMVTADEGPQVADRGLKSRYLVEERLEGPEYSVEALVRNGDVLFANITEKDTYPGPRPVELGHVVPAPLPADDERALRSATQALATAIGYRTGVVHAEWVLGQNGPMLVEAAGRVPGDKIFELMGLAYGINFYVAALDLLAGSLPKLPSHAPRAAAIRFLTATPGRVRAISGRGGLAAYGSAVACDIAVGPGDVVRPLRSSWDRVGHVVAVGSTPQEAKELAKVAAGAVQIVVD